MTFRIGADSGVTVSLAEPGLTYIAGHGNDRITGSSFDEVIYGWHGNDTIRGGGGNDSILGGEGADRMYGGGGNDLLVSISAFEGAPIGDERPRNVLIGGGGNDYVVAGFNDFALGGSGRDILAAFHFAPYDNAVVSHLDYRFIGGSPSATGLGTQRAGGFEQVYLALYGLAAGSSLRGSMGDDLILTSSSHSDTSTDGLVVRGERGNDFVEVLGENRDQVYGGAGDDILLSHFANDYVHGGAGADIFARQYTDLKQTGPFRIADFDPAHDVFALIAYEGETLPRFSGHHLIAGANPVATVAGRAQFLYDTDTGWLKVDANGTGAGGVTPIARFLGAPTITEANLAYEGQGLTLYPLLGGDPTGLGGWPRSPAVGMGRTEAGSGHDDVLAGTARNDRLFGLLGDDRLVGRGADDLLLGQAGNDTVIGGTGNDTLAGWTGDDILRGGAGDDVLWSGDLNGSILNPDIDRLFGGGGIDNVFASAGDLAFGGAGRDILQVSLDLESTDAAGEVVSMNFSRIGGAALSYTGFHGMRAGGFERLELSVSGVGDGSRVRGSNGDDYITVGGTGFGPFPPMPGGGGLVASVFGLGGNDRIDTGLDAARSFGGAGDDILYGSRGDVLFGGADSDAFYYRHTPGITTQGLMRVMDFDQTDVLVVDLLGRVTVNETQRLVIGPNPVATDPGEGQFLYDTDNGLLRFDRNGSDPGGLIGIAAFRGTSVAPDADQLAVEESGGGGLVF